MKHLHYDHCTSETDKTSDGTSSKKHKRSLRKHILSIPTAVCNISGFQQNTLRPLNHLRGKGSFKYIGRNIPSISCHKILLCDSLELFNRSGVRPLLKTLNKSMDVTLAHHKNITEIARYFFECIGRVKVTLRFCIQCIDGQKHRSMFDWYFIDISEISQQRTILCLSCMNDLLRKYVHGTDVMGRLIELRRQQPNGVYVDPFLISCGY